MKRRQFVRNAVWFGAGCCLGVSCGDRGESLAGQGRLPESLRFAATDLQGMEALQQDFGDFCEALAEAIALPVEPVAVDSFVAAAPALSDRRLDLVLAGPAEYLLLNARARAVPVVAITRSNYYSQITVRADSGIKTVQELKGKVIGMRAEGSTAGHIGASQLLADEGLDPTQDVTVRMVGNQGLDLLLAGEIDGWGESQLRITEQVMNTDGAADQVVTLLEGPPLPNDVFVASPDLDADFLKKLSETMVEQQRALLDALVLSPGNAKYRGSEFVPSNDGDYDRVRAMYRTLGLENLIQ